MTSPATQAISTCDLCDAHLKDDTGAFRVLPPVFQDFGGKPAFAGPIATVKCFEDNTLGPRSEATTSYPKGQPLGGSVKTVGSIEAIFPKLFDSPAACVSAFLDFGNVYDGWDNFSASELRASAGIALLWRSPMGPLSISYALPLRKKDGDQIERLQFNFGGQL